MQRVGQAVNNICASLSRIKRPSKSMIRESSRIFKKREVFKEFFEKTDGASISRQEQDKKYTDIFKGLIFNDCNYIKTLEEQYETSKQQADIADYGYVQHIYNDEEFETIIKNFD